HDSGTTAEGYYYAMPYIVGQPIDHYVRSRIDRSGSYDIKTPVANESSQDAAGASKAHTSRSERSKADARNPKVVIDETLRLFLKVCDAVNAAHLKGVIHRDLKPGNIMVEDGGTPFILDFGLARVAAAEVIEDSIPQEMTTEGHFIGSAPWSAPEQAAGKPDL